MNSTPARRGVSPEFRIVAIPAAIALAAIGAIAAQRSGWPIGIGAIGGALAAVLTVLALPSVPTRRATILLLGMGGLGALRHASTSADHGSTLLVIWAGATLVALLLLDRADADTTPAMRGATLRRARGWELLRHVVTLGVIIAIAVVAFVPVLSTTLARQSWPGAFPLPGAIFTAPTSLRASNSVDMTQRPRLSNKVVFTVDAPRADLWRGETFDVWDGHQWTVGPGSEPRFVQREGTTVYIPASDDEPGAEFGEDFRQTYRIETGYSDVMFAAATARVVETDKPIVARPDGSVFVTENGLGKGAVYTVTSRRFPVTAANLRAAARRAAPESVLARDLQLPSSTTARTRQLAAEVTASASTPYDKIQALIAWLGTHTKYSLDAPLSPSNVDVVDDFLFRSKLGWCEQIASSLVVMARSVGIPARLATGFAPGEQDPLTGRFTVRENDAHAWAEIYFPGIGWQHFDPTASVPLSGDQPSSR
ncbi:MAG TPA: transglutaminase domain-containing protein, partial [Acidimicrobiia bacterium]|nr:transglutaminase domain-containing protein [Acidimicrobiia bacterium]